MRSVTVVIVNYNGARHLEDCLNSLKLLDYPKDHYDVIVFDNGSTDDSVETVKNVYPEAKIIEEKKNLGFAAPHRFAAEAATGEVLAFLNNDMRVDREWIKKGVERLIPEKGIVSASSRIMTWDGKQTDFNGATLQYLGYADQMRDAELKGGENILFPCGGAMFISKDAFIESGGFDDDYFAIFEDVDLGWRLWVMGYSVVMAPESLTYHKGHATLDEKKKDKKRYLMHRNALMTIIKNYSEENLKKILPLAFVLAVKRALLFLGVNKSDFYFWEEHQSKTSYPDDYQEGCLHLAVMDDVFNDFGSLMEKRRTVQDRRKKADEEIFSLFRDPFRNIMGYKEYIWQEASLFGHFHLDELFKCGNDYEKRLDEGIYHARKTLRALTEDIQRKSFESGLSVKQEEGVKQLADKFYRNLRQNGFSAAAKKTGNYLWKRLR